MLSPAQLNLQMEFKEILFECPICHTRKKIKIPNEVIQSEKVLTTILIPSGIVCDHKFEAFLDKEYKVRGYQKIDFKISRIEFLNRKEDGEFFNDV